MRFAPLTQTLTGFAYPLHVRRNRAVQFASDTINNCSFKRKVMQRMKVKSGKKVRSLKLRKITFAIFFLCLIPFSVIMHYPILRGEIATIINLAGLVIIAITVPFAIYVHSLFPQNHDKPEDFDHLLTHGPYRYVRHPFYSSFIVMGFGIALYFVSIPGMILNSFLILLWKKLAEIEEEELLQYWGDKYRHFMETRPMFFPKILQRKR